MAAANMENPEMPVETKPLSELEEVQLSMNQQTDEVCMRRCCERVYVQFFLLKSSRNDIIFII